MSVLAAGSLIAALLVSSQPTPAQAPCPRQPMPPAIDSVAPLPANRSSITFGATPSLEYPRQAWVVRLWRTGAEAVTLEIVRLRGQHDCNRYDLEARWQVPLPEEEFRSVLQSAAPFVTPPPALYSGDNGQSGDIALDGIELTLQLEAGGWGVTRRLNYFARGGEAVSAIFYNLVSKYVPAQEVPTEHWRTRPRGRAPAF